MKGIPLAKHRFSARISKVETTSDTLTSRGGLSIFSRYLDQTCIFDLLEKTFGSVRKSNKGLEVWNLFHQLVCFFVDGTSRHLSYFDQIKEDAGYAASIQTASEEMASSHTIKRFFRQFPWTTGKVFRRILKDLFVWRLNLTRPDLIVIGIDTMVMDNDYAKKRQVARHVEGDSQEDDRRACRPHPKPLSIGRHHRVRNGCRILRPGVLQAVRQSERRLRSFREDAYCRERARGPNRNVLGPIPQRAPDLGLCGVRLQGGEMVQVLQGILHGPGATNTTLRSIWSSSDPTT